MAAIQAEMAALPEQPRDVVGDVRVCRYLRFYSGDVAKVSRGGRGKTQEKMESLWIAGKMNISPFSTK